MLTKFGQYTGNGVDGKTITGIGFLPTCVIIKDQSNGNNGIMRTSSFSSTNSISLREDSGVFATGIKSLDSDGFTLGTDGRVNNNTEVYNYIAMTDNGDGDFKVGSYTGNSTDPHGITGVGFQPIAIFVKGDLGRTGCARFDVQPANHASLLFSGADELNTALRSLDADGFTTGNGDKANNNATTYYYIAFKSSSGKIATISYTGDGTNGRAITTSFQPGFVYLKVDNGVNASFRTTSFAANTSQIGWDQTTSTGAIKSFAATSFTVDSDSTTNQNAQLYYGFYLYEATITPTVTIVPPSNLALLGVG